MGSECYDGDSYGESYGEYSGINSFFTYIFPRIGVSQHKTSKTRVPSLGRTRHFRKCRSGVFFLFNRFPLIINDVPPPPTVIINIPGGQKIFIIRGEYLLKGFGRAAFKFLLKSTKIKYIIN